MNNKVGLKDMFEHKEALTLMARSLNPNLPHVMQVSMLSYSSEMLYQFLIQYNNNFLLLIRQYFLGSRETDGSSLLGTS